MSKGITSVVNKPTESVIVSRISIQNNSDLFPVLKFNRRFSYNGVTIVAEACSTSSVGSQWPNGPVV